MIESKREATIESLAVNRPTAESEVKTFVSEVIVLWEQHDAIMKIVRMTDLFFIFRLGKDSISCKPLMLARVEGRILTRTNR